MRFLKQLYLLAYGFIEGTMAVLWVRGQNQHGRDLGFDDPVALEVPIIID